MVRALHEQMTVQMLDLVAEAPGRQSLVLHLEKCAVPVLGPAPAPVVKVNNRYRYRVTVIGRNDKTLRGLLSAFMKEFSRRPEHKALHIYTDCNLMD